MKKSFLIFLAFVTVLSVFCAVPVSANVVEGPYIFYDFETGTEKPAPASKTTVEIVGDSAYGGSSKSLKMTESAEKGQSDFLFPAFEIKAGDKVTLTFKYKLATPLKADNAEFALMIYEAGVKFHTNTFKIAQPADIENWHTATLTANDFENTFTPAGVAIRFGTMDSVMIAEDEGDKTIYIDDVCITREQPVSVLYDFEDNAIPANLTNSTGWKLSIVDDPLNSNNKVLQHISGGNATLRDELVVNAPWTKTDSEKMTLSLKLFVKDRGTAADSLSLRFKIRNADGYATGFIDKTFDATNNETWQTISVTTTNGSGTSEMFTNCTLEINYTDNTVLLFDDIKYEFERKSYAIPSVADGVTAQALADGTIVLSDYAYQEKATANPTGTDISIYKLLTFDNAVISSGQIANGICVPQGYCIEDIHLEIVPVSSAGFFGTSLAIPIQVAPQIAVTTIEEYEGQILVKSSTDLTDAKLIFVKYGANGEMLDCNIETSVTQPSQDTQLYDIPILSGTGTIKVMLWQDFSSVRPLTNSIDLN